MILFYYEKPLAWESDTSKSKKHIDPKLGDYIKFNVQLGIVVNSLSSNYTRREQSHRTASEEYSAASNKYVSNYNLGFNFLFGKSTYIKHVIGVN